MKSEEQEVISTACEEDKVSMLKKSLVLRWKLITYHMKLVMGQSVEVDYGKMDIVIPPPRSRLLLVAHLPLPPDAGLLIQGTSWCDEVDCWALTEESWHRQQPPLLTPSMLGLAWVAVVLIGCRGG